MHFPSPIHVLSREDRHALTVKFVKVEEELNKVLEASRDLRGTSLYRDLVALQQEATRIGNQLRNPRV